MEVKRKWFGNICGVQKQSDVDIRQLETIEDDDEFESAKLRVQAALDASKTMIDQLEKAKPFVVRSLSRKNKSGGDEKKGKKGGGKKSKSDDGTKTNE